MELIGIIILSALSFLGLVSTLFQLTEWLYREQLSRAIVILPVETASAAETLSLASRTRGRLVAVCDESLKSELILSGLCDEALTEEELAEFLKGIEFW